MCGMKCTAFCTLVATLLSTSAALRPSLTGVWTSYPNALPDKQLPHAPLLGNGHAGIILDASSSPRNSSVAGPGSVNTLDVFINTNSMWSCMTCSSEIDPDHVDAACCSVIALGGLSVRLAPTLGSQPVAFSASQFAANASLATRWMTNAGSVVLTECVMHPQQDVIVTNVSWNPATSEAHELILDFSTWVFSDGSTRDSWNTATPTPARIGCDKATSFAFVSRNASTKGTPPMPLSAALATGVFLGPGATLVSCTIVAASRQSTSPWEVSLRVSIPPDSWASAVTVEAEARGQGLEDPVGAALASLTLWQAAPSVVVSDADAWWSSFWSASSISLPTRTAVEDMWVGAQYVLACASSTTSSADAPAPGLYGPWSTIDGPNWHGDYTLDYNFAAPYYGAFASNHGEQAEAYWAPIVAWEMSARSKAQVQATLANVTCPLTALYFNCHLAPWGLASLDPMARFMTWNGAHAALLFVNHWEFTRNISFARAFSFPLLSGLMDWYSCYLELNATTGTWEDTNIFNRDYEHEGQPVANPQIALALIARIAWAVIDMAASLSIIPSPTVVSIAAHLAPPNVINITIPDGPWEELPNTRCSDVSASWTFYSVPTIAACEAACDATPTCALFSYCPPVSINNASGCTGENDEPKPFTCWGMPLDQLPHCTSNALNNGWTSGIRGKGNASTTLLTAYRDATPAQSDWFALYPLWPSEAFDGADMAAPAGFAAAARASVVAYVDIVNGRGVDAAAMAVRAGRAPAGAPGFTPEATLTDLSAFLSRTWGPNLLPYAPGGGIENTGMTRAVTEMLLTATRVPSATRGGSCDYSLSLFPFWPLNEPASFSNLLAKGGFLVSAHYDNSTHAVSSPVSITAAHVLDGALSSRASVRVPWGWAAATAACGGVEVPLVTAGGAFSFDAPAGVLCELSRQ